ncbi:phosphopantetheine-binding protein [Pseudomonas kilonensis]|uniref:phosphopantetheine-binding protein n=1 Tax=Pseudomonas kilonensis TaxID=132476 RepID=UPI00069E6FD3|nr:phosphopantetheine-binding protein [Pseudomonas kilonensis]
METDVTKEALYSNIERIILQYCDAADLGITGIDPNVSLTQELGVDSVDFLDIVFEIEDTYKIQFPLEQWSADVPDGKKNESKMCDFVDAVYALIVPKLVEA